MTINNKVISSHEVIEWVSKHLDYEIYRKFIDPNEFVPTSLLQQHFVNMVVRSVDLIRFQEGYLDRHINNKLNSEIWLSKLTYYSFFNLLYVFRVVNTGHFINLCKHCMTSEIKNTRILSDSLTFKFIPKLSYDY